MCSCGNGINLENEFPELIDALTSHLAENHINEVLNYITLYRSGISTFVEPVERITNLIIKLENN